MYLLQSSLSASTAASADTATSDLDESSDEDSRGYLACPPLIAALIGNGVAPPRPLSRDILKLALHSSSASRQMYEDQVGVVCFHACTSNSLHSASGSQIT